MGLRSNNFTERKVIMEGQLCLKSLNDICSMFSHEEHVVTDSNNCPFVQNRISQKDNLEGFYIPSFQRGYRWTTLEVKQLVQDLVDFHRDSKETIQDWYCLQPLVVRGDKNRWVVIDGQQRLTTLFLIIKVLRGNPGYSIEYETRVGCSEFLKDIEESKAEENADYHYIFEAWKTIKSLIPGDQEDRESLCETILNRAKVIWYETTGNPYEEFSRLNSGKISLSNAELMKALLLKGTLRDGKRELSQLEAAQEWDMMEHSLRDDDFWCFINAEPNHKRFDATRIDFLFEMVLRMHGKDNKYIKAYGDNLKERFEEKGQQNEGNRLKLRDKLEKNQYFIFGVFQDYCKNPNGAIEVWKDVQGVFRRIHSWYSDRTLFHRIGYLMNRKGRKPEEKLDALASWLCDAELKSKTDMLKQFNEQIRDSICKPLCSLYYGQDNDALNDVLLLFNIAIIMGRRQEESRYPFREHKTAKWTLEHIHAKQERSLIIEDMKVIAHLLGIGNSIIHKESEQEYSDAINSKFGNTESVDQNGVSMTQICHGEGGWKLIDTKETHGLENLALLGHRANAAFNNSLYLEKRAILAHWLLDDYGSKKTEDKQYKRKTDFEATIIGTGFSEAMKEFEKVEFVPPATIMAFFKQFSPEIDYPFLWTENDANNYINTIVATLCSTFNFDESKLRGDDSEKKGA